ncbi:hypothetical protein L210DRAFT_2232379 [Boletus edulis BED1]|uniref:Uncharacterized protein n=1 Tax=Boletus edulis BED1 TaxID=1328754 RepID=A0AAD4BT15_BOLED|nr:hypothetical protein L210DRAFT_2232379 [Boletus edulis BED1]
MFVSPSSLTLNSFPAGSTPASITSATAYPFPDLQPSSTPFAPPPNHSSIPSSHTYSSPGSRSPPPSPMPPGAVIHPHYLSALSAIVLSSPPDPSTSPTSDSPTTDTRTSAGFTFTPTFTPPFPITPTTQNSSSPATVSSFSSFHSASSPLPSSPVSTLSNLPSTSTTGKSFTAPEPTTTSYLFFRAKEELPLILSPQVVC